MVSLSIILSVVSTPFARSLFTSRTYFSSTDLTIRFPTSCERHGAVSFVSCRRGGSARAKYIHLSAFNADRMTDITFMAVDVYSGGKFKQYTYKTDSTLAVLIWHSQPKIRCSSADARIGLRQIKCWPKRLTRLGANLGANLEHFWAHVDADNRVNSSVTVVRQYFEHRWRADPIVPIGPVQLSN
jgi:hypothetical protein